MNRQEVTAYQASGRSRADLNFAQPLKSPCRDCGVLVDLNSIITVKVINEDGMETETEMTEANARVLIAQAGIDPPPVVCFKHDEITLDIPSWA